MVSEVDSRSNTRFGIQVHKFSLVCTVPTKVDCNVTQTLHYCLVKGSARCIMQNHNYGGKFKTRLRFNVWCYKWKCFYPCPITSQNSALLKLDGTEHGQWHGVVMVMSLIFHYKPPYTHMLQEQQCLLPVIHKVVQ